MIAKAMDLGKPPRASAIDLDIRVVESHKKAPTFIPSVIKPIKLMENFSDFGATIARLKAQSNVDSSIPGYSDLFFELLTGRTEQTNKEKHFRYLSIHAHARRLFLFANVHIVNSFLSIKVLLKVV